MKKNKEDEPIPGFHCVEFQRKVREEMSELYWRDKEEYFRQVKQAMDDFIIRQEKAQGKQ